MPITKEDLIDDLKTVQRLYPAVQVTRNYYRANGKYRESDWQEFFPTFRAFLNAANLNVGYEWSDYTSISNLALQTEIYPILNLTNSQTGDFFAMGGKLYQVTGRNGTAVYSRRYRWYNRLHDWLRG